MDGSSCFSLAIIWEADKALKSIEGVKGNQYWKSTLRKIKQLHVFTKKIFHVGHVRSILTAGCRQSVSHAIVTLLACDSQRTALFLLRRDIINALSECTRTAKKTYLRNIKY